MQPPVVATLWRVLAPLALGLLAGALGTVMHRAMRPWGLVMSLALVLAVALTMRAWAGGLGYLASAAGVVVGAQVLASAGPGGDVLVPAGQAWGWVWLVGCFLALAAVAFAPRRWVQDEPSDRP